jgi:hypothetical protein
MLNINKMIIECVEKDINNLSKLKKSDLLTFTKSLLSDYYRELDNDTIKELYNEKA